MCNVLINWHLRSLLHAEGTLAERPYEGEALRKD